PFMVMATQNPVESYGTFPLPEAQTDRFFMRLSLGYMSRAEELSVIARRSTQTIVDKLPCVVTSEETEYLKQHFGDVKVSRVVADYLMNIIERTRDESRFVTGVSTRGAIALYKAAQVTAAFAGRDFVLPEDVRFVAPHVLTHRIIAGGVSRSGEISAFVEKLIKDVPVPLEVITEDSQC
ncbi:MAG TPA: magnesium chelatase, partial [Peptococcaceae bacterium]|nr:magnesium chelatase [Peptococcaceae bacterium]